MDTLLPQSDVQSDTKPAPHSALSVASPSIQTQKDSGQVRVLWNLWEALKRAPLDLVLLIILGGWVVAVLITIVAPAPPLLLSAHLPEAQYQAFQHHQKALARQHTEVLYQSPTPESALAASSPPSQVVDELQKTLVYKTLSNSTAKASSSSGSTPSRHRSPSKAKAPPLTPGSIHLNRASETDFQRLPRVGPVLAGRIVTYRTAHGGKFSTIDELTNVKGIGKKTLGKIRPYLSLN